MIFKANIEDVPDMLHIRKLCWLDNYVGERFNITREEILSLDFDSQKAVEEWENKFNNSEFYGFIRGDKIIGFIGITDLYNNKDNLIYYLYVDPSHQSMGVGQSLLNRAFQVFENKADTVLVVGVHNERAINFYKKNGFEYSRPDSPIILTSGKIIPTMKMIKKYDNQTI